MGEQLLGREARRLHVFLLEVDVERVLVCIGRPDVDVGVDDAAVEVR